MRLNEFPAFVALFQVEGVLRHDIEACNNFVLLPSCLVFAVVGDDHHAVVQDFAYALIFDVFHFLQLLLKFDHALDLVC